MPRNSGIRVVVAVLALVVGGDRASAQTTWPTKGWPTATPQAVGINAAVLDSIDAEIVAGRYGYVDRMLVIRRGSIAYDKSYVHDYDRIYGDSASSASALNPHDIDGPYNYYASWWHPYYRRGDLHTLQSVTKTVTSVVIGTAVTRGDFPSIDTPVLSFFDTTKVANIDDRKRRMTVRQLLNMTSGIDWNENLPYVDPRNAAVTMEASYDWVKFTIDRPMGEEPGARFNYNSGASQLLAYIFRKATNADIEDYAARRLFGPLGIQRWYWKRTPAGIIDTEGGLYLEARDLAKIWYLFAQNGMWDGQRLLSADWVRRSTTPSVSVAPVAGAPGYSLKWWLYRHPRDTTRFVWGGSGFGGQLPMAFPDEDLIIVFNGWNILPGRPALPRARIADRIVGALTESRPVAQQATGSPQYRSRAGVTYLAQADTGPVARADAALTADPRNVDKIIALGIAQSGARQFREAIETFSRGLAIAPNNALLYRWRGHRYLSVRELDRARADLTRGSRLDSTIYGNWYHLGIVRYVNGDFAGAADAFTHALPKAPDAGELSASTDWLWMSLSRAGRRNDAKALLDRRPDTLVTTNAYAARLKLYRGEIGPDQVITPADTSDVAQATLNYGIGNWYLVRGDVARAKEYFERSIRSGGWPAFGFIASEAELRKLR
jgi:CubicO group peptidase (beta-lactamase class C family)/Tfp pilus assembly protein PilF